MTLMTGMSIFASPSPAPGGALKGKAAELARKLAVRYAAYLDVCRKADGALPGDQKWSGVSCWAGMLRDTQIESGVTIVSNEYLRLAKLRAQAKLDGNEDEAFRLVVLMCEARS